MRIKNKVSKNISLRTCIVIIFYIKAVYDIYLDK